MEDGDVYIADEPVDESLDSERGTSAAFQNW